MSNNYLTSNIKSKSNENKTCDHYTKKCSRFVFECCEIIDPCRRCHIERECCNLENIKVKEIMCNECGLEQKPQSKCVGCGIRFDKSYCEKCFTKDVEHICSKKNYKEGICVICSESTYHSQSNSIILPCEHFIHSNCFNDYTSTY